MAATNANARTALLTKGTAVWVPDPAEAWTLATIDEASAGKLAVTLASGGKAHVDANAVEFYSMSAATASKVEDLTKLPNLHEPNLLLTLHERFKLGEIYTYTGPILLALNPFKKLPALYSDANLKKYLTADIGDELPPHAWRIADRAYKMMAADSGKNQSILVSGESGAGKTETTKIVMKYLTLISQSSQAGGGIVADRVLQVNPLIEAFGNAKTSRNDNSSRFGKLIQMRFDPITGKLLGAHVDTYLLEKARVSHQTKGERNYHIFYELAAAAPPSERTRWGLTSLQDFSYTNQSGTYERADVKDANQHVETLRAMDVCGLSQAEKEFCFDTVMAVLHLGNVRFRPEQQKVQGKNETTEGCVVDTQGKSATALAVTAKLLSVDPAELSLALTQKRVNVGFGANTFASGITDALGLSETFIKYLNVQQAEEARDALATTLYDRLFLWIVWRVNDAIARAAVEAKQVPGSITGGGSGGGGAGARTRGESILPPDPRLAALQQPQGGRLRGDSSMLTPSTSRQNRGDSILPPLGAIPVAGGRPRRGSMGLGGASGLGRPPAPSLADQERADPTDRAFLYDFTIGCLDIFGFEVFEHNSFEQLCINYANENLQQQFNEFVFELEQRVYQGEGIDWAYVSFPDNKPTLEMIEARPIGLLSLIDEECMYPKGDDKSLASKLYQNLPTKFPRFSADQKDRIVRRFVVHHFAGDVRYDVDGFYAKNKNELHQELSDVVRHSRSAETAALLPASSAVAVAASDHGGSSAPSSSMAARENELRRAEARHKGGSGGGAARLQQKTVGAVFKQQLGLAMAHIRASQPHYVRCIKPNDQNRSDALVRTRTVEQLRYSGVLEVIKVARAGYPTRFKVAEFIKRYYALLRAPAMGQVLPPPGPRVAHASPGELRKMAEEIVTTAQLVFGDDYQIGKTKVFLRPATFTRLEICKGERLRIHVVRIQRLARGYLTRKKYVFQRRAAVRIQAFYRGYRARCQAYQWRRTRRAAKQIQRVARGFIVRTKYRPVFRARAEAAFVITRAIRRRARQLRLKRIRDRTMAERAAVKLQSLARVIRAQKVANNLYVNKITDMAASSIQGLARIMQARKQKKALAKKRLDEKLPDDAQFVWWTPPLLILFLMANPVILVGIVVLVVSMAVGGGMVLDMQKRTDLETKRQRQLAEMKQRRR